MWPKEVPMEGLAVGLSLLSLTSLVLLFVVWRRNDAIQRALAEPRLVNTELLRLLTNSYAAAKLMLDECPPAELSDHCAERRRSLSRAVAAVDEFGRSNDSRG